MSFNKIIYLIVGVSFVLFHSSLAGDMDSAKNLLDTANQQAKSMTVSTPQNAAACQAAESSGKTYNSPEYQNMLHDEVNKIKAQLSSETMDKHATGCQAKDQNNFLLPDERIYIFISSSIPISTLKNYAADIDRLKDPHITMVMRGFVGGMQKIKPTMQFVREIISKDPQCSDIANCPVYNVAVNIDPILFTRYGIDAVPAILYVNGVSPTDPQKSEGLADNTSIANAYIVNGDVSFEYALTVIEKQSHSSQIATLLTSLKKGFYN